jgi:hypothetical protein
MIPAAPAAGRASDLARDLADLLVGACAGIADEDLADDLFGEGGGALARRLECACVDASDLARACTLSFRSLLARAAASDLASDLASLLADARDLADSVIFAGGLARRLDEAVAVARDLARRLDRDLSRAGVGERERGRPRRIAPSVARLLAGAARLLPAADRARYAEEYQSELWDIAQAGVGRIGQLRYALSQLRNALPVSAALRSPRRRSSAP